MLFWKQLIVRAVTEKAFYDFFMICCIPPTNTCVHFAAYSTRIHTVMDLDMYKLEQERQLRLVEQN